MRNGGSRVLLPWTILLSGCLDRLLESPYVLAPGLGEVRALSYSTDGRLLAATATGVWAVDGEGRTERLDDAADGVSQHPTRRYARRGTRVDWEGGTRQIPGLVDLVAGYDGLAVLTATELRVLDPDSDQERPLAGGFSRARALALDPPDAYVVVMETTLVRVGPSGETTVLAEGLADARAAATDAKGRRYVAQGAPEELWRVDPTGLVEVAKWLDDPRDLQFGLGGLLAPENLYIANGSGSVDYVRPP